MKTEQKKMNTYMKYGLLMLAAIVIGGILGAVSYMTLGSGEGANAAAIGNGMNGILSVIQTYIFPLMVILFAATVVIEEVSLGRLRSICRQVLESEDEEGDLLDYQSEKAGAIGISVNTISSGLALVILSTGYSINSLEAGETRNFLFACVTFILLHLYNGYWQVRFVKTVQKAHPEKTADPVSMKFTQQWLDSCDEAERKMIYRSSYKAYVAMQKLFPLLILISMLTNLFWDTGIFAVIMLVVGWVFVTIVYCSSCVSVKGNKHKEML